MKKPKYRLRSFFVTFYLDGDTVSQRPFIVPAASKNDAEAHVLKMIDKNDLYIPKLWDRYSIQ